MERSNDFLVDDRIEQADDRGGNSVLLRAGDTMEPDSFKVSKALYYWVDPTPNTEKGGPTFGKLYNPGIWSSLS